jgi:hypothetical protein
VSADCMNALKDIFVSRPGVDSNESQVLSRLE